MNILSSVIKVASICPITDRLASFNIPVLLRQKFASDANIALRERFRDCEFVESRLISQQFILSCLLSSPVPELL